jgi:hypothetical protein
MKIFFSVLLVLAIFLRLQLERPPRIQQIHQPLAKGEVYSELRRIGEMERLDAGAPVIFRTNYSAAGYVVKYVPALKFPENDTSPAMLVRWNDGRKVWVRQKQLRHAFTTAKK